MEHRVTAVLVAAGSSTRMGFDKLSFDLGGETVLERSVRAFDECPEVDLSLIHIEMCIRDRSWAVVPSPIT